MNETPQNPSEKPSAGNTNPQVTLTAMEQIVTSWTGGYGTHSLTLLANVGTEPVRLRPKQHGRFATTSVASRRLGSCG